MSVRLKARLQKMLAQEQGAVVRDWGARWPLALVFPEIYPVAMGNLGFQTLYRLINDEPGLACERAFYPAPEEWPEYRRTRTPILTLESQRPLRDFAAVAFSISFEADYPKALHILAQSGIPLAAAARGPEDPLVLAGGVATFLNPEPLAPFIDAFILGEAEVAAVSALNFLAEASPMRERQEPLRELAQNFPGIYVPAGYQPRYHPDGTLAAFEAAPGFPEKIVVPHLPDPGRRRHPQHYPHPEKRVGADVPGGNRPGLLPGLPLLRRGLCLPAPPGPPGRGTAPLPGPGPGAGPQDRPGGRRGLGPPRGQGGVPGNSGRGG